MDIVGRMLSRFFREGGIRQEDIAARLGCTQANVSCYLSGRRNFGRRTAEKWGSEFGFNVSWLLTGEGSMFADSPDGLAAEVYDNQAEFVVENSTGAKFYKRGNKLYMTVKLVPFAAYARFIEPTDMIEAERDEWEDVTFEVPSVVHGQYYAFQVKGDSMDNGMRDSFEEGDRVLVRRLNRQYWTDNVRFHEHPYWIVVTKNSILLKQMTCQNKKEGTFTFHSLNPSVEYSDFTLRIDDINSLYYVLKKKAKEISF